MSKDILAEICNKKLEHIKSQKDKFPEHILIAMTELVDKPRGFISSIEKRKADIGNAIIAEIKKASPSRGLIREDFDPESIAKSYEQGGAACISVLTDVPYFQGDDRFVGIVKNACGLPVLRKDFIIDPYQVVESRAIGADCILLIMAAVDDALARDIENVAIEFGMDVLIEVHDKKELERALKLKSNLIGINNRNLKTLEIDLANSEILSKMIPDDYIKICESGIYTKEDIARMNDSDINVFLIGESFMRQKNIRKSIELLLENNNK